MLFGKSILAWIVLVLVAICVFFIVQWLLPLVFGLVGFAIPGRIVNVLALLVAIGVFWYGPSLRRG